jgi:hypothetical protein
MIDPAGCRAQIGELAKRILDEAGDEHTPDPGAKPVGSAQPPADAAIASPGLSSQAGGASGESDWRAYAARVLAEVEQLTNDAVDIGETGLKCKYLLWLAQESIEEARAIVTDPAQDASDANGGFYFLEALVAGAAAVSDAPPGLKILAERAAKLLDDATDVMEAMEIFARESAEATAA